MNFWHSTALLVLATTTQIPSASAQMISGLGHASCATAQKPENRVAVENWIAGFWSALNAERNLSVGQSTDYFGINGEVMKVCSEKPTTSLFFVIAEDYNRIFKNEQLR